MNILEAKQEIKNTIMAYLDKNSEGEYIVPIDRQRPVVLIGAPGIGKTAIMSTISEELGIGFLGYTITHHTRQSAIGLPFISEKEYGGVKYSITEYTMSEIVASVYEAIEKQGKKEGILFIDEINCVSETLAPAILELLQHKRFGIHYIPKGWVLVAAGNPEEYNKSVNEMDMVTLDRLKKLVVEPDYDSFRQYALNNGIHEAIICFLSLSKDYLFKAKRTMNGFEFVTPRGWEDLSYALYEYEKLGLAITYPMIYSYLQLNEVATEFTKYYKMFVKYSEIYNTTNIEEGKIQKVDLSKRPFEERFSLSGLIRYRVCAIAEAIMIETDAYEESKRICEGNAASRIKEKMEKVERDISNNINSEYNKNVKKNILRILSSEDPKKDLEELREKVENESREAIQRVNKLFQFAWNSLGESQELSTAVMGTISNDKFIRFITKNPCETFYKLNEKLVDAGSDDQLAKEAKEVLGT